MFLFACCLVLLAPCSSVQVVDRTEHLVINQQETGVATYFAPFSPPKRLLPPIQCTGETKIKARRLFPLSPYPLSANRDAPDSCLSYCRRYSDVFFYKIVANPNGRPANKAILVKVTGTRDYSADFHWFIRSLVKETSGYHVYILLHLGVNGKKQITIPGEFRSFTIVTEDSKIHESFPKNYQEFWYHRDYPALYFWKMYGRQRNYKFVWSLAADLRYTGPGWGSFLEASYIYAQNKQKPLGKPPSYVVFFPICRPAPWWHWINFTIAFNATFEDKRWCHNFASGFAPEALDLGVAAADKGQVAYGEMFMPTLTHLAGFKSAWVKHPIYGNSEFGEGEEWNCDLRWTPQQSFKFTGAGSYHWVNNGYASKAYRVWANSTVCHKAALLHRVKY